MVVSKHIESQEKKKKLKKKVLNTKFIRLREQLQKTYNDKDKEVKQSSRNDKRNFTHMRAGEAEKPTEIQYII